MFTGWTIGGGMEQYVNPNLSFKVEYQHYDFGTQAGYPTNESDPDSPTGYQFYNWTTLKADSVKVGLNWRFAGGSSAP